MKIQLLLKKPASNKGGDRYEGDCMGENLVIYFPQALTRTGGSPKPSVTITVE